MIILFQLLIAIIIFTSVINLFGFVGICTDNITSYIDYCFFYWLLNIEIISISLFFILIKSFFIIPFIFYLLIGYLCSIKWFPEYVKNNSYNKDYYSYKGYVTIYSYILFYPLIFIKRNIKTPYTELNKHKEKEK